MFELHQPYQIIQRTDDIEYRFYPAATFAQVHVCGTYVTQLNSGFRELLHYISGGNHHYQSLECHAPVVMQPHNAYEADVCMYLGHDPLPAVLPAPLSDAIAITHRAPMYMAAITLCAILSPKVLADVAAQLYLTLRRHNLIRTLMPEYRFYTSPWQVSGGRGDVVFPLYRHPASIL